MKPNIHKKWIDILNTDKQIRYKSCVIYGLLFSNALFRFEIHSFTIDLI